MATQIKQTAIWNPNDLRIDVRYELNGIPVVASYQIYESFVCDDTIDSLRHKVAAQLTIHHYNGTTRAPVCELMEHKFKEYANHSPSNKVYCEVESSFAIGEKTKLVLKHAYGEESINVVGTALRIDPTAKI